jgi:hypothetical protein
MKLVLCIFEKLSRLKINFHKSEIYCFGNAKEVEIDYKKIFGYEFRTLPFKYLGILIHSRKLKNGEWKPVEDRLRVKLSSYIGQLLSYGIGLFSSILFYEFSHVPIVFF